MSTLCRKCGQLNPKPIVDYCSICGERPTNDRKSSGQHLSYGDNMGHTVNEVTLGNLHGKSASEESKELLAWGAGLVPEMPQETQGFIDGIALCKLVIAVAPVATIKYNAKPKMVLQRLNNVHLAVTTMESLGISTAGINTKEVADGNEKMIMNILRSLRLYSRRGSKAHSRRSSFSVPQETASEPLATRSFDGAALAAAAAKVEEGAKPPSPSKEPEPESEPEPKAEPPTVTVTPTVARQESPSKTLAELDAERLKAQHDQQEAELRALDAKIAAMNARLETLPEDDAGDKPPVLSVASVAEENRNSSTEGEEDSEDKEDVPSDKAAALEQLRQWKKEDAEHSREAAEAEAVDEIRAVAAGHTPPPMGEVTPKSSRRKGGRRRKKKVSRIKAQTSSASMLSDDDDSGISDSPDASDDEDVSKSPPPATESPVVPKKPTSIPSKGKSGRRRPRGHQHTKERLASAEADVDAVTAETEALDSEAAELGKMGALVGDTGADVNSPWYVSPMKQEELRQLGEEAAFVQGIQRMQALVRGKMARRKRKLLSKRAYIAREVVESEKTYVKNLGLCIDYFYEPMSKLSYISDLQLRQMFSEITVIRGFNAHLCGQLEARMKEWQSQGQRLGDIFLNFVAYFRSYTAYVNNYNEAMALFYQLQAKNKSFQSFLHEKKVDPALNGQELPAFLIMPIQRLPRYVMLLEDLLKNTPKDHADYESLQDALSKVQAVADYVNEKKREAENVNQVLDVQSRLTGMSKNLAEPHRRFVRQGAVANMDKKGETMLFLFNDILVTAKESHGLGALAQRGKEKLGFAKKGGSTPKMSRKAAMSPFFGKKKPQLQAAEDDREYKYQKTILLSDCKVNAQFGAPGSLGGAAASTHVSEISGSKKNSGPQNLFGEGYFFSVKTPVNVLHFGVTSDEELDSWLHDIDASCMRLVERKRMRCERTAKHHDGAEDFLLPESGRHVVNKADATFAGRVMLRNAQGVFEWKYVCLVKPHLYVFSDVDAEAPEGWLFLLSSHVVLGSSEMDPFGWSFRVHVPHVPDHPSASTWMAKCGRSVDGKSESTLPLDKELISDENRSRAIYDFVGPTVNEVLGWCRELRNVILDSVKLPADLCPLDAIQKAPGEDNEICADCGFTPTKHASVNLGVFLCAACAELHHELLDGISVVREIKDEWDITPQQRFELEALMGNAKRNKIFEKNATKKDVPKAKSSDSREARARWIKAKYTLASSDKDSLGASFGGSTSNSRRLSVNNK